ncbi:PREDICTED: disease resistance protein RML1B-like [Brassica oleracea var. oleracea]|nr:PREDICTED: disease resistance protein RML1B-like [Brassica oleracea var. oleracea]
MASSSSYLPRTWRYGVFTSFHGPDVRKTFLSHLRKQFNRNGITMFNDQGIEKSQTIAPALTQAISESRISIVVLSKNYASSSWCLDELVEILKCKEEIGQIVMTVFYGVDPSHVRKQTGEFGEVFSETCARKQEDRRLIWNQALNDVGNIAGEHFLNWDNEAEMIEKIARDVSDKLNATPSRDFDDMVGLEAHLREMRSLLDLDNDEVKMVAVSGPAGIGKSTLARALQIQLADRFQLTCFVDNLRVSYHSGLGEYGLKLRLQEEFLSKVLNQNGIRISHLGAIKERLRDHTVLIILDDVDDIKQLEALAGGTTWFGPRSRIVIITENKEILQQHGINNTYHVEYPSDEDAVKILCRYAFRQNYPLNGFEKLVEIVTELCGSLPLGLCVVGSSLRGKNEEEWEEVIRRLETIIDHQDIEEVLRIGYESLHENEKSLFLHIAVFSNLKDGHLVEAMFADNNLDTIYGLKILANKSLIHVFNNGDIVMHKLLRQMGRQAIQRQEPWKRQILIDPQEICDVLERANGTRIVSGISFDISDIEEVYISPRAFKRMPNLRFLRVYKSKDIDGNDIVHIPEETEFPRGLRLLHWKAYPSKTLPRTFHTEYLVEFDMQFSKLEKLWEGTQPLKNLRKMDLSWSSELKELPDLSKAADLEFLFLYGCSSLTEIPSSIGNLDKLNWLDMSFCRNLQVVPTRFNLAPDAFLNMKGCPQLRNFPEFSTNISALVIADTMLKKLPETVTLWSPHVGLSIYGDDAGIEELPGWIKDLHGLKSLNVQDCSKLASLPELPDSLERLIANNCESLEAVTLDFDSVLYCNFVNCFRLGREARRVIQLSMNACLPGRNIPAEFDHRAIGNSLTIRSLTSDSREFRFCVVVSPKPHVEVYAGKLLCRMRVNQGCFIDKNISMHFLETIQAGHLCICYTELVHEHGWLEQEDEIMFEFISTYPELVIVECGVHVLTEESEIRRRKEFDQANKASQVSSLNTEITDGLIRNSKEDNNGEAENRTDCWNCLFLCFGLSDFVRSTASLFWGRRQI